MSDPAQPRAILWLPDPTSPAGWGRRAIWDEQKNETKQPPRELGFHAEVQRRRVQHEDDAD